MTAPGPPDKRQSERVPILGELPGDVMVFQPITVREISRGGAQVETAVPLHPNSLHQFRLELGGRSVVVTGRVVHCRVSDVDQEIVVYCSGIEFVERSDHLESAIDEFINALKDGRQIPGASYL